MQELGQAGLLDYFSVVVGGDMVRRSKPDPEIYLRACREMVPDLVEPDEAVTKLAFAVYPSLLGVLGYFQSR